jgi:GNAT superfamily N-acetyltransferase
METLSQHALDVFSSYLRKDKYKNKIQDLTLKHCTDEDGEYILLSLIKIKKSQRHLGYGSAVMSDLINVANSHNVRIILWVNNLYGSDIKQLYAFYYKHSFVLIKNDNDGKMIYYPQKFKFR